jgi:hypothetical protein
MEVNTGFEPVYLALQASASPLGQSTKCIIVIMRIPGLVDIHRFIHNYSPANGLLYRPICWPLLRTGRDARPGLLNAPPQGVEP